MAQTQTKYLITLRDRTVDGDLGIYSTFSGGKVTAGSIPDRSPGQEYPSASGGDKTIEAITIGRRVKLARDDDAYRKRLRKLAGVEDGVAANVKPLDADDNPVGAGDTYIGTLIGFTPTGADNNSENEPATFEVEIQPSNVT